ncbi:2-dehydropantoate 2-reductase [Streptoalloteichus tenebrarius]|uniref:2-dehydropantoate 2-reductase n=1 Tax=Streptoalloteichus tenebrarius (strain ATCC 17920 / DSM 40477 / JCM 4838 / CBS 697.72 / NBRC 16177 / NCIMB 11028 / NRRL B-12390 / A12253. 1 / ISP 5477) TaxID=1933 RepID=A0ABT1HZP4_STRSD|nr:2-dehydropantoate 2-reductase [Streptoalloteichus tenebrarius]MCP2260978.1 2-dehydropantoate 2-reductase [Streptoalloteichus tenebrarius]BFE98916.1 2-dehydropantoate 2-reductase [Streptoalloteichus tenebrarius]
MTEGYTVVGGGAIGGTLAFHLARAGHPVRVVDVDAEHVAAIRRNGLVLRHPGGDERVTVEAVTPEEAPARLSRVLLAVKAQATEQVLPWLAPRLAPDGFVVSLQNGLNEATIAAAVGPERTIGAFVNLFADVVEPGVIRDGGEGALVVGEPDGRVTPRVERVVADLQAWGPAKATDNVEGFLWAKLGFGAMLATTALADAPMADLIDRHRPLMATVAAEVFAVATAGGRHLEAFDQFDPAAYLPSADPADREAATDRLVAWLRTQSKDRSGIWRDIAVRHRPVEVHHHYRPVLAEAADRGIAVPTLTAMLARLRDVETGQRPMSEDHLTELERNL